MSVGTTIKRARKKHGWRKADLARILGVAPQTILYWESGQTHPHRDRLPELAKLLGVDLVDLFCE